MQREGRLKKGGRGKGEQKWMETGRRERIKKNEMEKQSMNDREKEKEIERQ